MQKGDVNDPERTRGRKYHRSFSNTSESDAQPQAAGRY